MKTSEWFESKKRDNGESFVSLKDGRPEWLRNAVLEAHQGDLPNDWVYTECQAACEAIEEGSLVEDDTHEYVDGRVDISTNHRFAWAASCCLGSVFSSAEEEAKELGVKEDASIADRLGVIQFCAIDSIARAMLAATLLAITKEAAS